MKKSILIIIIVVFLCVNCTKKQKFKRAVHSEWTIKKLEIAQVSSGCGADYYTIVSSNEDAGTINFTKEKYDTKVAYSINEFQYKGYITDLNGTRKEFAYEYFKKLYGGYQLTIFDGITTGVKIDILTNKEWTLILNDYDFDCHYTSRTYTLSK